MVTDFKSCLLLEFRIMDSKQQIVTVTQLTSEISYLLKEGIGYISVEGEISNFKGHSSGHRYFTLKDDHAQIACVLWKTRPLSFLPKDGMKVIAEGSIGVYPPRGSYQLDCLTLRQKGKGDLFARFEELKAKLDAKGYFASVRKRKLPEFPLSVGIATSPTGAAIQDMLNTMARRLDLMEVHFRPTLVQGQGAAEDIVRAIDDLNHEKVDVIIIGRGGGSIEDLWCFNEEIVADAIVASKKPVISAVGHETDFTIADFCADYRAATPTAAAEIVTPFTSEMLFNHLDRAESLIRSHVKEYFLDKRNEIDNIIKSYFFRSISDKMRIFSRRIDDGEDKMKIFINSYLRNQKQKINYLSGKCELLNPKAPLAKGFALLRRNGELLSNSQSLQLSDQIEIIRLNETAEAEVSKVARN